MDKDQEEVVRAVSSILDAAAGVSLEQERRRCDREWDVNQATAALKAVTGLCTIYSSDAKDEPLDMVGRADMAALLSLISDRLERSAPLPS